MAIVTDNKILPGNTDGVCVVQIDQTEHDDHVRSFVLIQTAYWPARLSHAV